MGNGLRSAEGWACIAAVAVFCSFEARAWAQPYPASEVITSVVFDSGSHDPRAPGSDNWPITWADDGNQYTAWGDGGGFGGTNSDGRVSLGVARVEGPGDDYHGHNVWGGKDGDVAATFGGKSYGILSVGGVLYMWVAPGSGRATIRARPCPGPGTVPWVLLVMLLWVVRSRRRV